MKARRLPVDPGPAGWNRLLPEAASAAPLKGEVAVDWLVIGAGFAGLAAAKRLRELRPEAGIAVVDATRVGEGPAGRNSGFMIDLPHDLASEDYGGAIEEDRAQTEDNRRAIAFAGQMARDFGLPGEAYDPSGKVNAAATETGHRHNLDYARHLDALGEDWRMLDADEMQAMTGTGFYRSGLFTPGTAILQPAMFVRGVADGLRGQGVDVFEDSPVTSLEGAKGWVAETPGGRVRAANVILAVNGHIESFGMMPGRLMHVHTYASMTRALTGAEVDRLGGQARWGVTPADPLGTTVRRIAGAGGDRIVVRNSFTYDPSMETNDRTEARVWRDHDASFAARFPMLAGVGMEYRWGGRLCLSRNNVQVVGEVQPGLFVAACQNGLGTAKGTLAGMLAAEMACGVGSSALDRALAAAPPAWLPPKALAKIGANARIRWGEKRAGAEF